MGPDIAIEMSDLCQTDQQDAPNEKKDAVLQSSTEIWYAIV